ncbi:metacaspase 1 precursor, putative [Eimeria maxima]|uniref:Metacaspase 1, putative n=1 Tax=Eimeria maxima TaxID=5804 RepID=U6M4B0_EIMMA|nr:metacaspase 1 precursor, putative [Eimeria maxima]CDJ57918.1 metacaspase 1 precursor, putative [Eimeria maxima]
MDGPLRLRLDIVGIWGVSAAQTLYVKFLWRGDKQKSPPLRPSPHLQPQQHHQPQAEFLLPYDAATDGSRLVLRLWRSSLLKKKENPQELTVPLQALGAAASLQLRLQLRRFDVAAHQQQLQQQLQQQQQIQWQRQEQQRHEQQLALQDMQQQQHGGYPFVTQHMQQQMVQQQHPQPYCPQQHPQPYCPQQQQQPYYPQQQQHCAYLPPQPVMQQHQPYYMQQQQPYYAPPQQQPQYVQQQSTYVPPSQYQQQQQPQQPQQPRGTDHQLPQLLLHEQYYVEGQQQQVSSSSNNNNWNAASQVEADVAYIRSVLSSATEEQIKDALTQSNGDREKAVDLLLRQAVDAAAASHPLEVQQQQQEAASGAAAAAAASPAAAAPPYTAAIPPPQLHAFPYPQGEPMGPLPPQQQQHHQQQEHQQALLPASALHQPSYFPPHPGRRKALLIGINYFGTEAELRGCVNDAKRMQQLLRGLYGFGSGPTEMVLMTDEATDPLYRPTKQNMLAAMQWLTAGCQPGDSLFFHFSGHGSQQADSTGLEADGFDETILPLDFRHAGEIVDDELHALLVQPLPSACRLTAVIDACHSGSCLDLPFIWRQQSCCWEEETNPFYVLGDAQLFSSCTDSQTAADLRGDGLHTAAGGAMTTAFVSVLTQMPFSHSYPSLMEALTASMKQRGLSQRPQLSSSQRFEFNRPFSLTTPIPNSNKYLGRRVRKVRRPEASRQSGAAAAAAGGVLAATGGIAAGLLLAELLDRK